VAVHHILLGRLDGRSDLYALRCTPSDKEAEVNWYVFWFCVGWVSGIACLITTYVIAISRGPK
jgi:hypothetical protein